MSLKEHIEQFEKTLLEEKINNPTSNNGGMLQEHIARFEESLGETPSRKSTSKDVIFSHVEQLQLEIRDKDKIIENLKSKSTELTDEVLTLENEKSMILEELNRAKWLENNIAGSTKKIYEDKIKKMSIVDSTDLIPMLIEVSRKKQGNEKLNWGKWLEIPENIYLLQINEDMAKKVFEDTNDLIDKNISNINDTRRPELIEAGRTSRTRGGDPPAVGESKKAHVMSQEVDANYFLSFTGDTNSSTRKGDLVHTDFNPDNPDGSEKPLAESGFTISYWVRPDELGQDMFAIGRKAHNNERFTFGISRGWKGYFGVGANQSERAFSTMLDTAGIDKATHLTYDEDSEKWLLTIGKWYHFVVTYAGTDAGTNNMLRKIYMNGQQIWGTGVSDPTYLGNINWSQTGTEMSKGMSFGMRAVRGSGTNTSYNNGWACGLDEVAIYSEEKNLIWINNVYRNDINYDHTGADNLVGYWKFNEGEGTTVIDHSKQGNHGLLTNDSYGDDGGASWVDSSDTPTWNNMANEDR
jgi:hypothetical protein